jgi:hypothetical protein
MANREGVVDLRFVKVSAQKLALYQGFAELHSAALIFEVAGWIQDLKG